MFIFGILGSYRGFLLTRAFILNRDISPPKWKKSVFERQKIYTLYIYKTQTYT